MGKGTSKFDSMVKLNSAKLLSAFFSGFIISALLWKSVLIIGNSDKPMTTLRSLWNEPYHVDPQQKYLCIRTGARLGNNMFAYASALGLSLSRGMKLVASTSITETFRLTSHCDEQIELWGKVCESTKIVYENEKTCNAFDRNIWNLNSSKNVRISGCLRSWKYLQGHEGAIRKAFTFREHIRLKAMDSLNKTLFERGIGGFSTDYTMVGVHVRRGDRVHLKSLTVAPREYFIKAMSYMRKNTKSPIFIVCSDDLKWCKANLYARDVVFVETGKADVDLYILSMCNHTIMSVGTFGWWGAWLSNGTTLYYKHAFIAGLGGAAHTNMTEYMPPNWIAMS